MNALARTLGWKTAKSTARHSARAFKSKVERRPLRSMSLFSAGALLGGAAGWLAGRFGRRSGGSD
jgi:hypothetical protein